MRNASLYLKDILESIEFIEQFVAGMGLEDFRIDVKTVDI